MIDAGGYIMTNAHVVSNARRVQVVLPGLVGDEAGAASLVKWRGRTFDATIVGIAREIDLALLKVDEAALPSLSIADYDTVRQGELVFAFGSPEGLRNSVTMGIVSAVDRQQDADSPLIYIQTDAPITHGNSGGPLVNVNGELVGPEHVHPPGDRPAARDSALRFPARWSRWRTASCGSSDTCAAGRSASCCRRLRRRWRPGSACRGTPAR